MTISIWRYSHLTLAISSFIFILIASVTGIILAIEPISYQLKPYAVKTNNVTIAETLTAIQKEYDEVVTLKINQHNFVKAYVVLNNGKSKTYYINPKTGKKIREIVPKAFIYSFAKNLHRSLFLKSTGRILVAFFSFLLCLITVTGTLLVFKRQGGFKKIFSKIIYEDFNQFYHVVLSRYFLIPIIIITITGVFLSLDKLSVLPKNKIKHRHASENKAFVKKNINSFDIFKNTKLNELVSLEFPFSDDIEDYFLVKLKNKELLVHQYSGEIISNHKFSFLKNTLDWSLFLHTGRGSILWSLVLLLSCFAILFFSYSGFAISIDRRKKRIQFKNKFKKEVAEYIILVGSETGNTFQMANSLFKGLLQRNETVFLDSLNNYTSYKKATHLIIFTSTYGEGEAPTNASNFLFLLDKVYQPNHLHYAVLGFGSLAYTKYCQFAINIDTQLKENNLFTPVLPLTKINNQNFNNFKMWVLDWNKKTNLSLEVKQKITKPKKQNNFKVVAKTIINIDDTFLIRLQPAKKINFTSGDLLAITSEKDQVKRLYSIGKIENDILLSIKKHEFGICSQFLLSLNENDILKANIEKNKDFHFPKKAKEVILIANGTGIAPYLGMLETNTKTHLFCGLRTKESIKIYNPYLKTTNTYFTFSKEENKQYVQDIIALQETLITSVIKNKGVIMICGSSAMMSKVLVVIEKITLKNLNKTVHQLKQQIKTDCY